MFGNPEKSFGRWQEVSSPRLTAPMYDPSGLPAFLVMLSSITMSLSVPVFWLCLGARIHNVSHIIRLCCSTVLPMPEYRPLPAISPDTQLHVRCLQHSARALQRHLAYMWELVCDDSLANLPFFPLPSPANDPPNERQTGVESQPAPYSRAYTFVLIACLLRCRVPGGPIAQPISPSPSASTGEEDVVYH